MKIQLAVLAALAMMSSVAIAQPRVNPDRSADVLNQRVLEVLAANRAPAAPAPAPAAPAPAPASAGMNLSGIYLGVNTGSNFLDGQDFRVGAVAGYQFHRNLAAEIAYDYNRLANGDNGQMVMGNLVASRQLGATAVTPYVLAGAGVGWNALGNDRNGNNLALYNVGGGVRLNIVSNVDIDARYRYVGAFDSEQTSNQHIVTGGLNIRF